MVWKLVYPDSFNLISEFKMKKNNVYLSKILFAKDKRLFISIFKCNRGLLPVFAGLCNWWVPWLHWKWGQCWVTGNLWEAWRGELKAQRQPQGSTRRIVPLFQMSLSSHREWGNCLCLSCCPFTVLTEFILLWAKRREKCQQYWPWWYFLAVFLQGKPTELQPCAQGSKWGCERCSGCCLPLAPSPVSRAAWHQPLSLGSVKP